MLRLLRSIELILPMRRATCSRQQLFPKYVLDTWVITALGGKVATENKLKIQDTLPLTDWL